MQPTQVFSALLLFFFVPLVCFSTDGEVIHPNLDACREAALAVKAGKVIKVELKQEKQSEIYEFDIRDSKNRDWDIECDVATAKIVEIEEEALGTNDPRFREYMKIHLAKAKEIGLGLYPGEIIEIEFELEEDGKAVYEFDIATENGKEMKIEIDAATGEVHEETREIWQIGYE